MHNNKALGLPDGSVRAIAFLIILACVNFLIIYCTITRIVEPMPAIMVLVGQLGYAMGRYFSKKDKEENNNGTHQ